MSEARGAGVASAEHGRDGTGREETRLRSQVAALEQLLEVYEQTSLEQASRLEQALASVDRALAEAKLERQRLSDVFMQTPAAIAVLEGPTHVFTVSNPLYRELIGGRSVVGMPVRDALPEIAGQGLFEVLDRVYETGETFSANAMLVHVDRNADGIAEPVYLDFVYQALLTPDNRPFGIVVFAVDVTLQVESRKEAERKAEELARLSAELARSNQDLDQFAYVASHDLKAPLRGIANLTEWIEEDLGDKVTGESREHMELLKGRVHRMEALIDGILTYSRAGRVHEKPTDVDVGALLAECIELLDPPVETQIVIGPGMPVLRTERVPLQQVFMNLIGNAIKYNRRAGARVEVSVEAADDEFRFSVADNGPGIEPRYRERIWQIFQTLAPRDQVEGTGIGLSVVRKIVESRGGRTWLDSEVGRGTTFHFSWPIQPSRHP
ncbi:MAG TPA: ATP-binding protein [Gemmatimonadaceae bacterium]